MKAKIIYYYTKSSEDFIKLNTCFNCSKKR